MHPRTISNSTARLAPLAAAVVLCATSCTRESHARVATDSARVTTVTTSAGDIVADTTHHAAATATGARVPNEMGRVPVLMYHLVGDHESS